jgi:hypothetical protein
MVSQTEVQLQEQLIQEHLKKLDSAKKVSYLLSDMFGQTLSLDIITKKLQKNLRTYGMVKSSV